MIWRCCAMLTLIALVAACDDATVSSTGRRSFLKAGDLLALQDTSGLLVEVHGTPWTGATPEEIASTLRMPEGAGKEVRFRHISPGEWMIGEGERLVLHFNPIDDPDSTADCRAQKEIQTAKPSDSSFTVNATFCRKGEWLIHGFLTARAVGRDDWFGYTMAMRKLLGTLFPEK